MPERPCPHCELPIDAAASACPFCYQPVNPPGTAEDRASPRVRRSRLGPRLAMAAAVGLGALVIQVLFFRQPPPPPPAPQAPPAAPPSAAPKAPPPAPLKLRTLDPREKGEKWLLRGSVFDVVSLAPKPDAQLVFRDVNDGQLYGAKTDAQGLFRVLLPANLGGFAASLEGEGRIMEDLIPTLRRMSTEQRQEMIRSNPEEAWSPNVMAASGTKIDKVYAFVPPSALPAQPQGEK